MLKRNWKSNDKILINIFINQEPDHYYWKL